MSTAVYFPTASHARAHTQCMQRRSSLDAHPVERTEVTNGFKGTRMQQSRQMSGARSLPTRGKRRRQTHFAALIFQGSKSYVGEKKEPAGGSRVNFPTSDVPNEVVPRAGGPATTRVSERAASVSLDSLPQRRVESAESKSGRWLASVRRRPLCSLSRVESFQSGRRFYTSEDVVALRARDMSTNWAESVSAECASAWLCCRKRRRSSGADRSRAPSTADSGVDRAWQIIAERGMRRFIRP